MTEEGRSNELMYNLKGAAHADEITPINHPTWIDVHNRIVARFGVATAQPLIEAQRRQLQKTETVEQYNRDKMRLLHQTQLDGNEKCQQLTENLPFHLRTIRSPLYYDQPTDRFEAAQRIANTFNSSTKPDPDPNRIHHKTQSHCVPR